MASRLSDSLGQYGFNMDRQADSRSNTLTRDGISYAVRYIGCLEVKTSMKSLDFDTRSHLVKECIRRVCEAAGLKNSKRSNGKTNNNIGRLLGDQPQMEFAGSDIRLTVSSSSLMLSHLHSDQIIVEHDMPRISFASGGDTDTLDFVAYVAKNSQDWRACYVLECGGGLAQEVISAIAQAFDLRFKQFLELPAAPIPSLRFHDTIDRDYYNDLPGKVPPEVDAPPVPPLPNSLPIQPGTPNLIDLHASPEPPEHNYVNDRILHEPPKDVFDMHPFNVTDCAKVKSQSELLSQENWFHGRINRAEAEALLQRDGDFLVRESQGSSGQYVLTGMHENTKKHLLLIDPEGVVRTKDRMFENVSHLINYHCENQLPIISTESVLVLRRPITRSLFD